VPILVFNYALKLSHEPKGPKDPLLKSLKKGADYSIEQKAN